MLRYLATLSYIVFIVLLNCLIVYLPGISVFGQSFSPADAMVGGIYIVRDFAQREIKHKVFIAMAVGALLSYLLANKTIALASVAGFVVGELFDWAIYTFTKKPLSKRLIWSSCISSPIDSVAFLAVAGRLHWLPWLIMTLGKIVGVVLLWLLWRMKNRGSLGIPVVMVPFVLKQSSLRCTTARERDHHHGNS